MRTDQTAQFVASRPYANRSDRIAALYAHSKRVSRARSEGSSDPLSREPLLALSGTVIFADGPAECLIGTHGAAVTFFADSDTHRVLNRNGEPCTTWLCVRHWSEYSRTDGDDPDLPIAEVRFSRALEA